MIKPKLLKEYGFYSITQYFDMICNSFDNGQFKQAKKQAKELSLEQRIHFMNVIDFSERTDDKGFKFFRDYFIRRR